MAVPDTEERQSMPVQPRVQAPAAAAQDEIILVKALISHPMETGLRHDPEGRAIPRNIINTFACSFDGETVFSVNLHEAMAANPYLEFSMRATRSGLFTFVWQEDGGALYTLEKPLTVG